LFFEVFFKVNGLFFNIQQKKYSALKSPIFAKLYGKDISLRCI